MNASRFHRESATNVRNGSLVSLPDGRRLTYSEVIREAEQKRSQAVTNALRALLGLAKSNPAAAGAVPHPSRLVSLH